ncbi:calcium-independent phospholipase A2-gamma-like isoform X2 [Coccinella septempunctata]|uniref:calcium-independent phospholipase A2-gamma-like isoform X2 n=1 Tax=Coccinella septempunctata TaxID=41139 RepID=UPI001D08A65F|nr:calcium-independent phospholipase A2-gamma-like isoform X2 [Coccinella septempunctata]
MSFSKNIKHYRVLAHNTQRSLTSGSTNSVGTDKMYKANAKNVLLTQSKLISQLKKYISKIPETDLLENALNKEFAQFLQKLQPRIYGSDLIRFFTQPTVVENTKTPKTERKESVPSLSIPDLLETLKIKINSTEAPKMKETVPKWLVKPIISKEAIASRTEYLLSAIKTAKQDDYKLSKIDEFCEYLKRYQDARHIAVKEGGIRSLLKIRYQETSSPEVIGALQEALSLLGYTDTVEGTGLRILSIDGGGTRGLLVIQMLKKLEELAGRPILDMFDMVCGVSTGAIIASLLVVQKKSLDEIEQIYESIGTQVFTQHPIKGTSNLVWSQSYYDTALWEKLLKEKIGTETLISTQRKPKTPKLLAVSAVMNKSRLAAYLFRNYNLPCKVQSQYFGSSNHRVWEAVRASAAAPTYFEEFKLGNMLHQDGGILVNNPTAVAIHEAKLLWPHTPLQCVVSFGTGRTELNPIEPDVDMEEVSASSWKSKFMAVIDSATDTEGVHSMLSDLLPPRTYYRFNPYLTEMLGISEICPEKMNQLKRDALMYLRRNEEKFQEAADTLNIRKGPMQKLQDYVSLQLEINGIISSKY